MEWVETTGKTLEEAKAAALDRLGVHEEDAEFDVLEEPQQGLFGRVRRSTGACVRPAQARLTAATINAEHAERPTKAKRHVNSDQPATEPTTRTASTAKSSRNSQSPQEPGQ